MSVERKRLESYLDDYEDDSAEGMGLKLENYEGGGNNMPDESEYYERRLDWLNENNGSHPNQIWKTLAEGEYKSVSPDDGEELVFVKFPQYFLDFEDNEDWKATIGDVYGYYTGWAILDVESSEGKKAWAFKKFHVNGRWRNPRNKYSTLWGPRACFTLFRRDGEPDDMDKEKIRKKEALPDGVDAFKATEDDYDWRVALGAAYRRIKGEENNPLKEAKSKAQELPDKIYKRVEIGVDEYMRQSEANGEEVSDEELAKIINVLTTSLEPGATLKQKNK